MKQAQASLVDAEERLRDAFSTDVRPLLREWRRSKALAEDPMKVFRESGYLERVTRERARAKRRSGGIVRLKGCRPNNSAPLRSRLGKHPLAYARGAVLVTGWPVPRRASFT